MIAGLDPACQCQWRFVF